MELEVLKETRKYSVSGNTLDADNGMTTFNGQTLGYDANGNLLSDGTNSVTANLLTGLGIDEYFARTDSSGTAVFLRDALGSTVRLGSTSYTYQPFGATTVAGTNANPYQFTGRENDGTGLYYYRARYYSPSFQRFIAQDPIGFGGGSPNIYAYEANAPTVFVDPFGLNYWLRGVEYNDSGTPIGELGLQPEPPIPDVTIGLDSPVGGVQTTLPFGSGGAPTTVRRGLSYNYPLPDDYNLKIFPQTGPGAGELSGQCQVRGPFGGVGGGLGTDGVNGNVLGPQLNFPLPYSTNVYIGTKWNVQ